MKNFRAASIDNFGIFAERWWICKESMCFSKAIFNFLSSLIGQEVIYYVKNVCVRVCNAEYPITSYILCIFCALLPSVLHCRNSASSLFRTLWKWIRASGYWKAGTQSNEYQFSFITYSGYLQDWRFNSFTEIKATAWLIPALYMFQWGCRQSSLEAFKSISPNVLFKINEQPVEKRLKRPLIIIVENFI